MRKRSQILATITLVLAVCALALICFWTPPEYYAGKPFTYWLRMLNRISPAFDPPAEWKALGTNEVAVLVKALKLRDSKLQMLHEKLYFSAWNGSGPSIFKKLPIPRDVDEIALNALVILSQMGTNARPAFPTLIHIMQEDRNGFMRGWAAICLATLDPSDPHVRPALISSLSDTNLTADAIKDVRARLAETEPKPAVNRSADTR